MRERARPAVQTNGMATTISVTIAEKTRKTRRPPSWLLGNAVDCPATTIPPPDALANFRASVASTSPSVSTAARAASSCLCLAILNSIPMGRGRVGMARANRKKRVAHPTEGRVGA